MGHSGGRDAAVAVGLGRSNRVVRVVVVDDTPDVRMLLRLALESEGDMSVVAEAADGREAVDVVAANQPDLVVLDLAMPVMDGMTALPHLRRACPGARILVLSG